MKNSKLVHIFLIELRNQLYVPPFQRDYSWDTDEYTRLFEDILELVPEDILDKHFVNTIIHKPQNTDPSIVGNDLLVDGQQRLTTITLLYAAICSYCKHHEGVNKTFDWKKQIYHSVLVNDLAMDEEHKLKIRLRKKDDYFLRRIILELPAPGQLKDKGDGKGKNLLLKCYNSYYNLLNEDNVDLIFSNMKKLEMYDGEAEPQDDPQELYDSLNTTGKALESFEQIRNYLLMSFDEDKQLKLYERYWEPMEKYFTSREIFNKFMHAYVRYLRPILFGNTTFNKTYISLKRELHAQNMSKEDCIQDIYNCFMIYKNIQEITVNDSNYYFLKGILALSSVNSGFAVLFRLYNAFNNQIINENELKYCLELYSVHLLRYKVAKSNGSSLNTKINMGLLDESDFCNSFERMLFKAQSKITDSQFKQHILVSDFYYDNKTNHALKNILERIEMSFYSKGFVNFENYTIEHIMPQTLTEEWKQQLGKNAVEIHNTYLNDIGNLTLTAYNSEYSNDLFEEKLEMENGFKDDRLHLSKYIAKYNHWNEDTIKSRTEYLSDRMVTIFSYDLPKPTKKYNTNQSTLQEGK